MARFDILFFDLDGTLLGPDHAAVSPRNQAALRAASRAGVRLAFATGRCLDLISPEARSLPFDYAVTSNGTAVHDLRTGKRLLRRCFTPAEAGPACRAAARLVDFFELFADGQVRLLARDHAQLGTRPLPPWHEKYFADHPLPPLGTLAEYLAAGAPGLEKLNMNRCDPAALERLRAELTPMGLYEVTASAGVGLLEVVPKGCTKGAGIRWLCESQGLDIRRTAAFGDGGNDLEMLQTVGCGVAMGNADNTLKAVADAVTAPYDRDGVAQFIEQYVL